MKTPLTSNPAIKPTSPRDLVISRLKAINCWPVPTPVVDRLTAKLNAKMATLAADTIKGFGSVASAMAEIEKEGSPQAPT
jgi:hypothetical protein